MIEDARPHHNTILSICGSLSTKHFVDNVSGRLIESPY